MQRFGFKISGCFGDVLYSTPVLRYLSRCHNDKLDIETNRPELFINNPYVGIIYNPEEGNTMPFDQIFYDCNIHNFRDVQKQIRKMYLTDYWSTNLGFTLTSSDKTLEFHPNPLDIEIPNGKYVILNPSKTWECRTWSKENWEQLIDMILVLDIKIVLTGQDITYNGNDHKSFLNIESEGVINLINKLNLSQLWHLIDNSLAVVTMATGLLTFAGTTDTNIIELGSATHPEYRTPYRKGSQNYKHKFVGGLCQIHCQSDMKYNGTGNEKITTGFPLPGCYENKSTFECHPTPEKVFNALLSLV